jgi:hypothetical protein
MFIGSCSNYQAPARFTRFFRNLSRTEKVYTMKKGTSVLFILLVIVSVTDVGLAAKPADPGSGDPLADMWDAISTLQSAVNGLVGHDTDQDTAIDVLRRSDSGQDTTIAGLRTDLTAETAARESGDADAGCSCPVTEAEYAALQADVTKLRDCQVGKLDCDADWLANGCEVDPATDTGNCGACGAVCTVTNAVPACYGGMCTIGSCTSPYGNCDNVASNGCEANLNSDAGNCGTCGISCMVPDAISYCSQGSCVHFCRPPDGNCDGDWENGCERDIYYDELNCGSCGYHCPDYPDSASVCRAGSCDLVCDSGYRDCDGGTTNGCEVQLGTNENCASCGNVCGAGFSCVAGQCAAG